MHNWRLLLFALIAILQPIASFTERSLVDGRQQCCDRQQDLLFQEAGYSLEASRRIATQERRLEQRDDIYARRNRKHSPILIKDRTNPNKDKLEYVRLFRTDNRLTTAATDRRTLRHFDKQNLDRRTTGQRILTNSVPNRNDVEFSLRSSRNKRSTSTDGKNIRRISSDKRFNLLREQSYSSKFRTKSAIEQEFQTSNYEIEQDRLHNRNNRRVAQERRSMNRLSSPMTRNDNNRKSHSREFAQEFRSVTSPTIDDAVSPREYRQNGLSPITTGHRVEYMRINVLNNRLTVRNTTPERRFERFVDSSSNRDARPIIRRKIITAQIQKNESDESRRFILGENRKLVSDITTTRRVVRNVRVDSRESRRDITNNEVTQRVLMRHQHRNSMYRAGDTSYNLRVESATVRKDISNPSTNYRFAVSENRIRNINARDDRHESYSVRKDSARREVTRRQINANEWQPSSDIRNVESDRIRRDNIHGEFSKKRTEDRKRQTAIEIERRQLARRVELQLTRRNSVNHDFARKDTTRNVRTDQMRTSERGQITRDSVLQQFNVRNTRDEQRNNPITTRRQSQDMRRVESAIPNTRVDIRDSIRTDTRNEDKTRQQHVPDSSRRLLKNVRDMTVSERTEGKLRKGDVRRHREVTHGAENRRDIHDRQSNLGTRSLDRIHFRSDTSRTGRLIRSVEFAERSNARQQVSNAKDDNRDRRSIESRLHSTEIVTLGKELSKINSEEEITGNWQMLFYILQGIYMWSIIAQAFKENGSTKPKTTMHYWWTLASQHLIKLD